MLLWQPIWHHYWSPSHYSSVYTTGNNRFCFEILECIFKSCEFRLPKTSYVKMIDIWLLFVAFIPFAEVVLHTRIAWVRQQILALEPNKVLDFNEEGKNPLIELKMKKIRYCYEWTTQNKFSIFRFAKRMANFGLPLLATVFLITFFIIGIAFIYEE